jgi:protein O-mannosyl-transferase
MAKKHKKPIRQPIPVQPIHPQKARNNVILACIIVAVVTVLTFIPALSGQFTNWDDNEYVTENPYIRNASMHGVADIFTTFYSANYHPLTSLTYMAEYAVCKLNPTLYHVDNLLLHTLNAVLLLLLIYILTSGNLFVALGVALLFALHPLRVESVAWVSERKDVLSGLWYIVTLILYSMFVKTGTKKWYVWSLVTCLLALLSKPMSVTLPLVLFLIDYVQQKKITWQLVVQKTPFFIGAAVFAVITVLAQKSGGAIKEYPLLAVWQRLCIPFYAMGFYCVKTIAPFNLSTLYFFSSNPGAAINIELVCAPIAFVLAVAVLWFKRLLVRPIVFGLGFFIITLLPVMQIIPVGNAVVADRYSYLPMIGIYFAGVWAVWRIVQKKTLSVFVRTSIIGSGVAIVLFFAVQTFLQCRVWHDSFTLWDRVIAVSPCGLAYNNRAVLLNNAGKTNDALDDFNHAIELSPGYVPAYANRGDLFNKLGRYEEAMTDLNRAVALLPADKLSRYNRGTTLLNMGYREQALEDLTIVLSLDPKDTGAYNNRGIALLGLKRYKEAIADLNKAIALAPNNPQYYNNRATAFLRSEHSNEAFADYNHALAIQPDYAEVYLIRGNAYVQMNKLQLAIDDYTRAISYKPDLFGATYQRAQCYYQMKRYDEAAKDIAALQQAGVQIDDAFVHAVMQAAEKI